MDLSMKNLYNFINSDNMQAQTGEKISKFVFVGIKATKEIIDACEDIQKSVADLPVRFVSSKDIHLTLLPPWKITDQNAVEEKLKETLFGVKKFTLEFKRLACISDNRRPRFIIWIEGIPSEELIALRKKLSDSFGVKDEKNFTPHMTIAKSEEKTDTNNFAILTEKSLSLFMQVESVELFASPRDGSGYQIIASYKL